MQTTPTDAVATVHRLLFRALLEMRAQGQGQKDKVVYHLADLFHNIVLEVENAAEGRCSCEDVWKVLEMRAKEKGLDKWLYQNLADLSRS